MIFSVGFPTLSYERACDFRQYLRTTGRSLTVQLNMEKEKTPMPAKKQIILGCMWDSAKARVRTAPVKVVKYLRRIKNMLQSRTSSVEDLQKLHGNLNYASEVSPFGRPFLAALITPTIGKEPKDLVDVTPLAKMGLRIWYKILLANRGTSFSFILNQLPRSDYGIFADASKEWGIGGCCGPF